MRDTISLQFRKMTKLVPLGGLKLSAADADQFANDNCGGVPLYYHVVAADGLTMAQAQPSNLVTLQPGYRNDLLVTFPEPGTYCVLDASSPPSGNIGNVRSNRQVLGFVQVADGPRVAANDVNGYLTRQLVIAAERNMPNDVKAKVIGELQDRIKLTSFVPHPTIDESEITGEQNLVFYIDLTTSPLKFEIGNSQYDLEPYSPDRIDRTLQLGTAETWNLRSHFVSHPFHIHVNPFQIVEIIAPDGKDVSEPGSADPTPDGNGGTVNDPQYAGLKGVWKDTLWVKSLITQPIQSSNPPGVYKIKVRTRYQRYIGEYVLHCHILDHEDQGMMQNVEVVLPAAPGGRGRSAGKGHTH